ncbi:hypothetical protein ERO13_A05G416901v2 [Gossypium hirsutum]|uniref:Uncharacterized protein isoform X1 n=1 Tax=Gossypium hirsutum TaxID=3635 RepID=A0A1U8MM87_GOSHI|nr:uncharacterized protein LOC107938091 isoform X1 [Gossypium hirsutum]XP_040970589.1 uncharacterized protein LOC107938091 isoform X1 [Gossypium hirsutum]XP_040970590.1 uncharacterized protein LOC107938091 isoform X1 [Gossypium hirsutum]XP_040970591.1 uncharacterized protein LOC107938091 isoform X1 [Gossypium hirsutum]KAG4203694.1 hypothetical protein ERO13_A05G416901v2 [Gossypium hirsutum]
MFGSMIQYFSTKPKPKMKPIELKTSPEQTQTITRVIFDILKEHGPLTVGDTWERVKEVGLRGLTSKSYMKIVLRWMRGRQKIRLICNHVGPSLNQASATQELSIIPQLLQLVFLSILLVQSRLQVLKEASRLYAASWVRDIGPDLRPNDYKKGDGTEGKSNGDTSRSTETEPSTLEDIGEELYFVVSYLEMF